MDHEYAKICYNARHSGAERQIKHVFHFNQTIVFHCFVNVDTQAERRTCMTQKNTLFVSL